MGELHRLGRGGNSPSGSRVTKSCGRLANDFGLHRLSPPPQPFPSHVDTCPRSFDPNRLKSWPAARPLGSLVSGLYTLSPRVTYISGVTLILLEFQITLLVHEIDVL
jgi:hypothetical protein